MKFLNKISKKIIWCFALLLTANTYSFAQEPFLGEIKYTGNNFCPRAWAATNGQILPISQNQSLYSLLGTTFGGDGRTTFALPDMRGTASVGISNSLRLGTRGGREQIVLVAANMPPHTHTAETETLIKVSSGRGRLSSPDNAVLANDGRDKVYIDTDPDTQMSDAALLSSTTIGIGGSSVAINNMQPSLVVTSCIAIQGIFPSRN